MEGASENPGRQGAVGDLVTRLVSFGVARAWSVALAALAAAAVCGVYLAGNISIRTDLDGLIAKDLPWRRAEAAVARNFPQMGDDIAVVIDGVTPERAARAASALAAKLKARPDLFVHVDQAGRGEYFDREGLLFLSLAEVQRATAALIEAQPLLGPIAADPSLRGLANGLELDLTDAEQDPQRLARLAKPLGVITEALDAVGRGAAAPVSWRALLDGAPPDRSDLRRIVRLTPKVDYSRIAPGEAAIREVGDAAKALGLTPAAGVRLRLTGGIPMAEDELSTLGEAVGPIAALSLACMFAVLFVATRSLRVIAAIAATVFAGLLITSALGLVIYGEFNLISVAFMPLFVGLGVDFAVQFAVRYRAVAAEEAVLDVALVRSGASVGRGVALAAAAAAIGFLSFLPTSYKGVSELGGVAGLGMIVAFLLTLTLLPALIRLFKARPPPSRARSGVGGPMSRVLPAMAVAGLVGVAALPLLRFDFDPLSLRNPRTESVSTYLELARDRETTPETLDIQRPDLRTAAALAQRLARLPQVAHAYTLADLVPADQAPKLAVIADAQLLLDTTLTPFETASPPSDAEIVASLGAAAGRLRAVAAAPGQLPEAARAAVRSADVLDRLARAGPEARARAQTAAMADLPTALDEIRSALSAEPVTLETLPADLKRDWTTPSGAARIEVWPSGDPADPRATDRFVSAVRQLAPDVSGTPVTIREAGRTVLAAFAQAAGLSVLATGILLFVALRSLAGVVLTLAPVVLTLILTLATCVALRQAINLENIIALPLILGIGVSFNIYLVSSWREGAPAEVKANLARAILFSALTTATAFGSLLLSSHPGTASLGLVLTIALGWTLVTSLLFQPALLARTLGPRPTSASPSSLRAS